MSSPSPQSPVASAPTFGGGAKIFDRFELIRKLGQGGMGQVWLAMDSILEREVALKFLPDMLVNDPGAIEELRAETRRALRLTHQGIVRTYDFFCAEQMACIAMEYVNGGTLTQLRIKQPDIIFQPEQILHWIQQACEALHYAHTMAKVAHRDLKPSNIMIDEAGRVKLTDFGIARSLSDSVSRVSNRPNSSGTLPYMSPQQLYGEKPHAADDVYAMGATIFELLSGKPPFYSGSVERQIVERIAPTVTQRRAELEIDADPIPEHWERVIAACLSKERDRRPQSMQDLATALSDPVFASEIAPTCSEAEPDPEVTRRGTPLSQRSPDSVTRPATVSSIPPACIVPAFPHHPATSTAAQASSPQSSSSRIILIVVALVVVFGIVMVAGGVFVIIKLRESRPTPVPIAGVLPSIPPSVESAVPAPVSSSSAATPQTLPALPVAGTTCQGVFTYDDNRRSHSTDLKLTFSQVVPNPQGGATISGTIAEPRVDFGPDMPNLPSTFTGSWIPTPDGKARITFTKTYSFGGAPSEHTGIYDQAKDMATGTWDIHGYSGAFTLTGLTVR